jgi:hypothetical protein
MPVLKSATPNGQEIPHGYAVINPPSEIYNPKIPTYLPLDQAAQKLGLSKKVLTQQIQAGKIGAVQLPSGELLVAADNNNGQYKTKVEIIAHYFAHLRGQTINAYQAQEKYGIRYLNFIKWARAGYIQFRKDQEGPRPQILMDEAEVAYCAYVYRQKEAEYENIARVRIFDKGGNPYRVKYPDLAAQRRK